MKSKIYNLRRVALLLAVCACVSTAATVNDGSGFTNHSDLQANGSATFTSNGTALLTDNGTGEAGSIFTVNPVLVQNFTSTFTFSITGGTYLSGNFIVADGMTFCIQGNSPAAVGGFGVGLGYATLPKSVAVKFDVYDNAGEGNDSTGVFTDGAYPTVPSSNGDVLIALHNTGIDLLSGHIFKAVLTYNGGLLTIHLTDTTTAATFSKTVSVNIPALVGGNFAYAGFTGGTGGAGSVQTVYSWTYGPVQDAQ